MSALFQQLKVKDNFLENSQLQSLLRQAQNGDDSALKEIVLSYQRLITKVVFSLYERLAAVYNKGSVSALEIDDLLSIAQVAFIKAVNTFLPEKNVSFVSFAATRIKFELVDQIKDLQGPLRLPRHIFKKREQLEKNPVAPASWLKSSFQAAANPSHSIELSEIPDGVREAEPDTYELYKNEFLDLVQLIFSQNYRLLFSLKLEGYSCKEISVFLSISEKQVSKMFRKIIGNARNLDELEDRLVNLKSRITNSEVRSKELLNS